MADYILILNRAISNLQENTPEVRAIIYDKARRAIDSQLRALVPAPTEESIAFQLSTLENAIKNIEQIQPGSELAVEAVSKKSAADVSPEAAAIAVMPENQSLTEHEAAPEVAPLADEQVGAKAQADIEVPAVPQNDEPDIETPVAEVPSTKVSPAASASPVVMRAAPFGFIDDITLIEGIGAKTAAAFYDVGVYGIRQIAGMKDSELAEIAEKLGIAGYEIKQEWKAQAHAMLSGELPRAKSGRDKLASLRSLLPVEAGGELVIADGFVEDVTLIDGIGEKISDALAKVGVTKISQIAAMSNGELAAVTEKIGFPGFEMTQEWKAQAGSMLSGNMPNAKSNQERLERLKAETAARRQVVPPPGFIEDVMLIDGIGEKTANALAEVGVTKISQIAMIPEEELAAIAGKIGIAGFEKTQEWQAQAIEMINGELPRAKTDRHHLFDLMSRQAGGSMSGDRVIQDGRELEAGREHGIDAGIDTGNDTGTDTGTDFGISVESPTVNMADATPEIELEPSSAEAFDDDLSRTVAGESSGQTFDEFIASYDDVAVTEEVSRQDEFVDDMNEPSAATEDEPEINALDDDATDVLPKFIGVGAKQHDNHAEPSIQADAVNPQTSEEMLSQAGSPNSAVTGSQPPEFNSESGEQSEILTDFSSESRDASPVFLDDYVPPSRHFKANRKKSFSVGRIFGFGALLLVLGAVIYAGWVNRMSFTQNGSDAIVSVEASPEVGVDAKVPPNRQQQDVGPAPAGSEAEVKNNKLEVAPAKPETPQAVAKPEIIAGPDAASAPKTVPAAPIKQAEPVIPPVTPPVAPPETPLQTPPEPPATQPEPVIVEKTAPRVVPLTEEKITPNPVETTEVPVLAGPTVGELAFLYEEAGTDVTASRDDAFISWKLAEEAPNESLPPEAVIKGMMEVLGRDLTLNLTIRRNVDPGLPASHVIELRFDAKPDFSGGYVDSVPRIVMKSTEQARGEGLIGVPAKIDNGYFYIALNNLPQAKGTNERLLLDSNWIDIPIGYVNGRRALVTMDKGVSGDKVFREAFADWKNR